MFFLLLLVGATVALPLQSQPETEDALFLSPWNPVTITLGEESDNLFDDILKAVQFATPIVTALAGKRDVADSEWFDTFLAAVEAATPTIVDVIQGAGTTRDVADSEWFDTFLAAVEAATPTILGVIQGATTTREINWDLITPIIEPLILPVLYKRALETQDNLFDIFVDAIGVLAPVISAGKRELTEEQANLFGDILGVVETIAPLALAVGKREVEDSLFEFGIGPVTAISRKDLTEEQENLFGDILGVVETIAPLALAIGKREVNWEELLAVVANTPPTFICDFGCIGKREVADSEWFDTFLSAVEAATPTILGVIQGATTTREINWDLIKPIIDPLILPVLYKRAVADSEWFDTFLAAVEAATPTILGVIQGTGTAKREVQDNLIHADFGPVAISRKDVADSEWFDTFLSAVEAATPTILGVIQGATTTREINWDLIKPIIDPIMLPVLYKRAVADSEWFDTFLSAVEAATPTILGVIQGATTTRELTEEQENLFGNILGVVETIAPLALAVGKREVQDSLFEFDIGPVVAISRKDLTEEQENLFGDILGVVETIAPLALAIGKREVLDTLFDEILAVVATAIPPDPAYLCEWGCIGKREVADSEWFDTFLAAVEAATPTILGVIQGATTTREINWDLIKPIIDPLILPVLYKRAVADSEWFDTFLAAVEAATPTILGVIQGAGAA